MRFKKGGEMVGRRRQVLMAGGALFAMAALAGCSSIPDSVNPSHWADAAQGWVNDAFDWVSGGPADQTSPPAATPKQAAAPATEAPPKVGNDTRPDVPSAAQRQQETDQLVSDRANAKYDEAEQQREGSPTRPLATESAEAEPAPAAAPAAAPTPAPQKMASAQPAPAPAPAPPPKPVQAAAPAAEPAMPQPKTAPVEPVMEPSQDAASEPMPRVVDEPVMEPSVLEPEAEAQPMDRVAEPMVGAEAEPQAEVQQPVAQPAPAPKPVAKPTPQVLASAERPAPQPAASPVAAPARPMPVASAAPAPRPVGGSVQSVYQQRLAEFANPNTQTVAMANARPAMAAGGDMAAAPDGGVKLNPPGQAKLVSSHGAGGAKPLGALNSSKAAASFEVAELVFGEGTAALSPGEEAHLKDVVTLFRQSGSAARIAVIGHSNSPRLDVNAVANSESNRSLAAQRADVVALALERMGVPGSRIYAGGVEDLGGDRTEVYVEF